MRAAVLLASMAPLLALSSTIRMARPRSNNSAKGKLVFTKLSRFDAEAWSETQLLPLKMQSSALSKMPGTFVSHRQMMALMSQSSDMNVTMRTRGFRLAEDVGKLRPSEVLHLQDLNGAEYAGEIEVGTKNGAPQAKLRVIFDTGSTDLWILSDMCTGSPCTNKGHHSFDHRRSETFTSPPRPVELFTSYGSGELNGLLGFDTVRMGPLAVQNQMMGLISQEVGQAFETLEFDGLVGLGFPSLGFESPGALPFVDSLMQQGSLPSPCFGFYLHRDPSRGGAVLWGGADKRLYRGPLRWFPVVHEAYWTLDLVSFRIGEHVFDFEKAKKGKNVGFIQRQKAPMRKPFLVVDSGTTLFTLPGFMLSALQEEIGFGLQSCSALGGLPPIVFQIRDEGGAKQEVAVTAGEYMVRNMHFDDMCLPAVIKMDMEDDQDNPIMIIGEVFMRHYFTVFSRGQHGEKSRVGFARSNEGADAEAFFTEASGW